MNNLYGSAVPAEALGQISTVVNLGYNGSGFELTTQNTAQVLLASQSVSATVTVNVTNNNARGIVAYMNITSGFPGSGSTTYTLKIKAVPPNATASAVTIAAAPARSASGMTVLACYPGAIPGSASNTTVTNSGFPLPRDIRVVASLSTGATSKEVVMSIGIHLIV